MANKNKKSKVKPVKPETKPETKPESWIAPQDRPGYCD
jgi:hypothetical protein